MNKAAILSIILIILGQSGAWFQQFASVRSEWMRNHTWVNILVFGVFVSFAFVFAAKYGMYSFGSAWSYRLIQFSVGIFVFTYLTHVFLGEIISTKNGICIGLSFLIILIQAFWK